MPSIPSLSNPASFKLKFGAEKMKELLPGTPMNVNPKYGQNMLPPDLAWKFISASQPKRSARTARPAPRNP